MKLLFNLDYQTSFGEQLMMNIIVDHNQTEVHAMSTRDGLHWTAEISRAEKGCLDYYYSVCRGSKVMRHEWLVEPHRLEMPSLKATYYRVYDRWIDIPEDSYLYSSAFTDCVMARACKPISNTEHGRTIRLKVRAPQLQSGSQLAIVGNASYLGYWDCAKARPMTEHAYHEWVISLDADRLPEVFEFKFVILGESVVWENCSNRVLLNQEMAQGEVVVYELAQAWFSIPSWKGAGTVIPVFSLRSEGSFGVGDFGDLKLMVDWCAKTQQRILQVLPINDTTITHTWQDSYPYNSISIYALHPQYTDLRQLPILKDEAQRGAFEQLRQELNALPQIDYERVNKAKMDYLRAVFTQEWTVIKRRATYKSFFETNKDWLEPYARFCYYRDKYGTAQFSEWPAKLPKADPKTIDFWYFVQYNLDQQMRAAHQHAREKGVILKGDIPIGISRYGVEAWVEPRYFNLNGQAGAPPDAFSVNGQNWGFPTYNWDEMLSDGCQWWVRRFRKMQEYFDAYRIDHVLGFFRIWEIPIDAVHGLLGQFSPALGMTPEEIEGYGLHFQEELFTRPFIADWTLQRIFGERASYVKEHFLNHLHDDIWEMKPEFNTQRKVEAWAKDKNEDALRDGLYALISDVLFVRDRKDTHKFHPRIGVQNDFIYEALWDSDKDAFNRLYNDYFYHRNNQFWYTEAMKKLPLLTQATRMLVCAEDLGMVPDCVPWVMDELRILSLEIQSMPKNPTVRFGHLQHNPYRSVATISTHDMATLRQWWDEDFERTQAYYNQMLHHDGPAPHPLTGYLAEEVVSMHLMSPSMLCLLSLQDWLSIDEQLRLPNADAERINIPANPRHYWRYRMHLTIEQLMQADAFNREVSMLIRRGGR
ncbi:4-alpha-glucanotransferase [Prevotella sp. E13-17]|uniref:4-alpha-glucanotransferase n=1 Tax=Prevotella sp. E13-17 TaxID=2913616 RepID=UPI001EDA73FD|nr:4-alpha-glucanotransferase [Prevotella sp. E13-17]UKK50516.1 4-alpha-glucanotransferase [Prevotella sp. E13-17]